MLENLITSFVMRAHIGLRTKFIFAAILLYVVIGVLTFFAFRFAIHKVVTDFGAQLVKKQSLLVKNKTLSLIRAEVVLSTQMVDSPVLKLWAQNEDDATLKTLALQELESYRTNFRDKSVFFIISQSGDYYFNNATNEFKNRELRYTLNPSNLNDQWYFTTMKKVDNFALNVDYDNHLKITKVWINTVVRGDKFRKIGLAGTGFELTDFINTLVHSHEPGLTTVLIDSEGGIEGHPDDRYMKHNSNLRGAMKKITIYDLMRDTTDQKHLSEAIKRIEMRSSETEVVFVSVEGRPYLAGVSQIEDIGWYVIVLADLSQVVHVRDFIPLIIVTILSLLVFLLIISVSVNKMILRPLSSLSTSSEQIAKGNYRVAIQARTGDELGQLANTFNRMAQMIKDQMENLEERVAQRTAELTEMNMLLDQHARTDPLTGLGNRREILRQVETEISRSKRFKRTFSIVLLDLDEFKNVNDSYGHAAGDLVLREISQKIREVVRSIDTCGRWGGEEFLLVLPETDLSGAIRVAENLRKAVQTLDINIDQFTIHITLSAGVSEYQPGQSTDDCIKQADAALYRAKRAGRNRVSQPERPQLTAE